MICAPAAERPASVGDQGRRAESAARTAQMITLYEQANSESVLGEFHSGAQSPLGAAASGGIPGTWVSVSASVAREFRMRRSDRELPE